MEVQQEIAPAPTTIKSKINILGLIGPTVGVVLLIVFLVLPPFAPLTERGMKVAGIFLFTMVWWATVGLGWPSLLALTLLPLTGAMSTAETFAFSWGDSIIPFLLGVMGLGGALRVTGFSRRFALWFMTRPFVKGRPWAMTAMLLLSCSLLGMVMSLSANCIIFMSIVAPMLEELGYKRGDRYAATAMMAIGWASTTSFVMTPIASTGNVMVMSYLLRDTGYTVAFQQWFLWGVPMGLLVFVILFAIYRFWVRPDVSKITEATTTYVPEAKRKMGPMKAEEKLVAGVFITVIIMWLIPDLGIGLLPGLSTSVRALGRSIPALVGACLLCLIPVKGKPVLSFNQWMRESVEWTSVSLVATIQIVGDLIGDKTTGIPVLLTSVFQPLANNTGAIIFVLVAITWVVLQTNVMSNLVSGALVYSVMVPVAIAAGITNPVALGVSIVAASNLAFALPSATTSTALIIGSGWVPVRFMFKYGAALILPMILLYTFVAYPFACLIFK